MEELSDTMLKGIIGKFRLLLTNDVITKDWLIHSLTTRLLNIPHVPEHVLISIDTQLIKTDKVFLWSLHFSGGNGHKISKHK